MPVERGNPNVFTVFKGRFECEVDPEATTTNATIMLTCVNDVQFWVTSRLVLLDYWALYQQGVVHQQQCLYLALWALLVRWLTVF